MPSRITAIIVLVSIAAVAAGDCQDASCSIDDSVVLLQAQGVADNVIQGGAESLPKYEGSTMPSGAATSTLDLKASIAEYLAMTLFVTVGCGSAMGVAKEPGWVLQVALTFGVAITVLVYGIAHYSGGHINSAVTLAMVVTGHCTLMQGIFNFIAQLLGAITGALILTIVFPEEQDKTGGLGTNAVPAGRTMGAFVGEMTMTFLLVFVIFETAVNAAAKANSELAPLAIGFAVFLAHTVLIPITGCSINPTRSLGPALVRKFFYAKENQGTLEDMWVFWVAPCIGAVGAAVVSTMMMAK